MDVRAFLAAPLLSNPLRALRTEAASLLAPVPLEQLPAPARPAFERAAAEFVASQRYNADRPEGRVNLGTFEAQRGDAASAEREMRAAMRLDQFFIPAYINLADVYRILGNDSDGVQVLQDGLRVSPDSAVLHHALGLALVRMKRIDEALGEFRRATVLEPTNARFSYMYGVARAESLKLKAQSLK